MGRQDLQDVTLIRHAYVDPAASAGGGTRLLAHLLAEIPPHPGGHLGRGRVAIRFYEKHGFRLVTQAEKDRLSAPTGRSRTGRWKLGVLANPKWFSG